MQKKCKICIKNYEIIVDLNNTNTAKKIWENLPITSNEMYGVKKFIFTYRFPLR